MGSVSLERKLIFLNKSGQKPAAGEVMGSRSEVTVTVLLNLHAMPIKLPSNYLYLCPKFIGAVNFREASFCIRWCCCCRDSLHSQSDEPLTVECSAINGTSVSLHQGSGTITGRTHRKNVRAIGMGTVLENTVFWVWLPTQYLAATFHYGAGEPHFPLKICSQLMVAGEERDIFFSNVYPGTLPKLL